MSARFDAAADYLLLSTGLPNPAPLTICWRQMIVVDRNAIAVIVQLANSGGSVFQNVGFDATGTRLILRTNGGNQTGTDLTAGVWRHITYVHDVDQHRVYLNGVLDITFNSAISFTPAFLTVGGNSVDFINGRIQDVLVAQAVYTPAEIIAQHEAAAGVWASGTTPYAFYPLAANPNDTSGNARHMSANGTIVWEAGVQRPATAIAIATAPNPTVVTGGGGVTVTPAAAIAVATAIAPTVVRGAVTVAPAAAIAVATAIAPSVVRGAVTVAPAAAIAMATAIAPSVVRGAVIVTPAPAIAVATAVNPTVNTGGGIVTPAPAVAVATAVAPIVILGPVTIAPAAAIATATAIEPTVVRGAVTIVPAPAVAVATAPDPFVIAGVIVAAVTLHAALNLSIERAPVAWTDRRAQFDIDL